MANEPGTSAAKPLARLMRDREYAAGFHVKSGEILAASRASEMRHSAAISEVPGKIRRQKLIARADVQAGWATAIFVFGDNMQRKGFGGQAKAMRGEPNAIGVPTKWAPDTRPGSYFSDADFDLVRGAIDDAFLKIRLLRNQGLDVIIPADGLGTGLADLPRRAPRIHRYIEKHIAALDALA